MKNITKVLALIALFTGLNLNAEVESKDNNLQEIKTTHSERVLKFAKDHKKKLIAGTAFAVWCGAGLYKINSYGRFEKSSIFRKLAASTLAPAESILFHLGFRNYNSFFKKKLNNAICDILGS